MTWHAFKGNSIQRGTQLQTFVTLYDDVTGEKSEEPVYTNDGKDSSIAVAVLQIIAARTAIGTTIKTQSPPGTEIDLTPPASAAPPNPTQAEIDRAAFTDAMNTELRQRVLNSLSPDTQKLFNPAWFNDIPVVP